MLGSDLRALRNLFRTREGHALLIGQVVVLLCVALGALAFTGMLLGRGLVHDAVRAHLDGNVVRALHAVVLLLPVLFTGAIGTLPFRGELYTACHVPALLTAPVSSLAIVQRAFVRSLLGWSVFGAACVVPVTLKLADGLPWRASPALAFAAMVGATSMLAPLLACQLLLRVAAVRWCSGGRARRVLLLANAALFLVATLALVLGFVRGEDVAAAMAGWFSGGAGLPWILEAPASLPAAAAGFAQDWPRLLSPLLLFACSVPPLLVAAAVYRSSYDVFCASAVRTDVARARSRSWPEAPLWSLLAKLRAETVRVSSNLAGHAFLATVLVLLLAQGMERPEFEAKAPIVLREMFFLLAVWQGLALLMASLSFLNVIGNEQRQIALLTTSPLARRTMLRAKLIAVALPFSMMLLITMTCAPLVAGVGMVAVGAFSIVALPLLLYLLGVLLAVGTWPQFICVHDDMPLANNMRSVVPVLVIGACGVVPLVLQGKVRSGLVASYYGHGVFAPHDGRTVALWLLLATWVFGIAVFAIGYRIAVRNTEKLLAAQD
ncbi:MAG: hypothetical protein ABIP94_00850 [Planctomycetota bacterium]